MGLQCIFFQSSQGVRQGDPLSPFLFIIMVEALSTSIQAKHSLGLLKGVQILVTSILNTHSLFVDDTLLFGETSIQEAKSVKDVRAEG